ncbi:MAG TPA: LLM class flavin-dependent oxidoreductase [Candidatus Binataceae bacterium]|nr:LLM class flavin-dependent oxidoreductase [Candidatus Binataceae bacterium]
MEFALQYELQRSRPHYDGFMWDIYHQATEQVKLADRLGYHSVWTVEHHFLNEWSYSSAPEVWYGALSQVTKQIRLGHGVCLLPIPFNHPARIAERIAVLDIMSNGRVEFGSGRSITEAELDGFQVHPEDSKPMWEEAIAAIPKMWTQEKFSWDGKYFKMPEREVIPKPVQKPHPPIWVAATQPTTWEAAGHRGIGALGFGISEPGILDGLVKKYKNALKSCEPVGSFINDRTAAATVCVCAPTREEAIGLGKEAIDFTTRKGAELFTPFANREVKGYEYYKKMAEQAVALGDYRMSHADLEKRIEAGAVMVGDPEDCLKVAKMYESAGVDLLLMLVQVAALPHEKVMQTIDLIGKHVMPKLSTRSKVIQIEAAAAAAR